MSTAVVETTMTTFWNGERRENIVHRRVHRRYRECDLIAVAFAAVVVVVVITIVGI